jgi:hypothetical protein
MITNLYTTKNLANCGGFEPPQPFSDGLWNAADPGVGATNWDGFINGRTNRRKQLCVSLNLRNKQK